MPRTNSITSMNGLLYLLNFKDDIEKKLVLLGSSLILSKFAGHISVAHHLMPYKRFILPQYKEEA